MASFPEQTVSRFREIAKVCYEKEPDFAKNTFRKACAAAGFFSDLNYGFYHHLRTGEYAPYEHEKQKLVIADHNCTTIIPNIHIFCSMLGLNPEIVQFIGFRDIEGKKDKDDSLAPSHFAVIIDAGRKQRYLLDPFWRTFGPILEEGDNYLRIGKFRESKAKKREFKSILRYSESEFAEMMDRLHSPAESLDMLVAGQKVEEDLRTEGIDCSLMIYYDDRFTVSTRLDIPQVGVLNKAIMCHTTFDENAGVNEQVYEFFAAKEFRWMSLVNGKKIAQLGFSDIRKIKKAIKKGHARIGPEGLEEIAGMLVNNNEAILPMVFARTLYEFERPGEEYVYSEEAHDERLLSLIEKEIGITERTNPLRDLLFLNAWKLKKFDRNMIRRTRHDLRRYEEKKPEIVDELNSLNRLREKNKKLYHRLIDMALFAQRKLNDKSVQQLGEMVEQRKLNPAFGYAAMVADFIPYACKQRKMLELAPFIDDIKSKMAARMERDKLRLQVNDHRTASQPLLRIIDIRPNQGILDD